MGSRNGLERLAALRFIVVSGKGGVGKTAVAAALAADAASRGRRTLLFSSDGRGDAAALFGKQDRGYGPTPYGHGLEALTASFDALLSDFVETAIPFRAFSRRILASETFRYFTRATPGLPDLLLLGKVREVLRREKQPYDLVVLDAPAMGHALSLIGMPRTLLRTIPAGPLRHVAADLDARLADPRYAALVVVAEPAELAAREAEELIAGARETAGLATGLVVVNRIGRSGRAETLPKIDLPMLRVPELDVAPVPDGAGPLAPDQAFFQEFREAFLGSGSDSAASFRDRREPIPRGSLDLDPFLRLPRLLALVGPGGVGKTTLSAACGIAGSRLGRRVLVLTVDPARRLAQALGLEGVLDKPVLVPTPGGAPLRVMQIDPKASFERLLGRIAGKGTLDRIHANRLYSNLVDSLPGVIEYMGVEALAEHAADPETDMIVLDTAPASRGIDFLRSPERMVELLDHDALRWFLRRDSLLQRALSGASRGAAFLLQTADKQLGFGFLSDLSDFFMAFEGLYDGFKERSREISRLLGEARYLIVSSPDRSALRTAADLALSLPSGSGPTGLLLNRVSPAHLPRALPPPLERLARLQIEEAGEDAATLPSVLASHLLGAV